METLRCCPQCESVYVVQHGGQKSGGSPSVRVPRVGGPAIGYCSERCEYTSRGWPLDGVKKYYEVKGLDYDEIFPPGYLAPSRIPTGLVKVARIRNLLERQIQQTEGGE